MDTFKPFQTVQLNVPLFFQSSRYEEYEAGQLVSQGQTSVLVRCTYMDDNRIKCIIGNNDINEKLMSCEFDACISLQDRILMFSVPEETNANIIVVTMLQHIIGTTRQTKYYYNIEPVVGSIYTDNGRIVKMSFTMANPERLIEFY